MFRTALVSVAAAVWAATAGAAPLAPHHCPHVPEIIWSAGFLATDPKVERRFWRDRVGADAAYLIIRYGDLSQAAGMRLVAGMRQRRVPPERIDELRLAFAPPGQRLALLGDMQEGASVPPGSPSFWRAMIVDGREAWLFGEMARRAAAPGADRAAVLAFQAALARSLLDLSDADKTRIAAKAEAAGLFALARDLLGTTSDPAAWLALVRRSPEAPADEAALARLFAPVWRGHLTLRPKPFALESLPPELRAAAERLDAQRPPGAGAIDAVLELVAAAPAARFLLTLVDQTGEARLGEEVAWPVLARLRSGALDAADADALQALLVDGAIAVLGYERTVDQLRSFRLPAPGYGSDAALGVLQRAVARHTLLAYARGQAPEPPGRPRFLSATFDWVGWLNVARAIRAGERVADSYLAIQADLLHAAGRHGDAIALLERIGPTDAARGLAHDILLALDRRCAGLLAPPAPLGEPVFRFPPR